MFSDEQEQPQMRSGPIGTVLDETTRFRLGQELRLLYEPILDETLDPRLAELMLQLKTDRDQQSS